ncbi:hypothetical protein ACCQ08_24305 [Comamonas sp. SY3]|uniref:hypothetical protein n=1 Tax=Comamonas sp. SY3 TaxID=3243601 RepID=UPI003594575A
MKNLTLVVACSAIALSACSKGPVDIVKSSFIDGARTTTVANGLGKRPLCKSIDWDSFKDGKSRVVVQYKCTIIDGEDFQKEMREDYLQRITKAAEQSVVSAMRDRESAAKRIEEDFPYERNLIERAQRAIERIQALPEQRSLQRDQIMGLRFEIEEYERGLEVSRREAKRKLQSAEDDILTAQKRNDTELLRKEAMARHPVYQGTSEIFQWIVNAEGQPVITYGEIQAKDVKGQEQTLMKYNQPHRMLGLASQAQESKILDYMQGIGMASFLGVLGR